MTCPSAWLSSFVVITDPTDITEVLMRDVLSASFHSIPELWALLTGDSCHEEKCKPGLWVTEQPWKLLCCQVTKGRWHLEGKSVETLMNCSHFQHWKKTVGLLLCPANLFKHCRTQGTGLFLKLSPSWGLFLNTWQLHILLWFLLQTSCRFKCVNHLP